MLSDTEAQLEVAEQKKPHNLFLFTGWSRLIKDHSGSLQFSLADEEAALPDLGELDRRMGSLGCGLRDHTT